MVGEGGRMVTVEAECIVPTVFRADVESYGYHEWSVKAPDELAQALSGQIQMLCELVSTETRGRVQLLLQLKVLGQEHVVTSLKKGTRSRIYRIQDPWLSKMAPKVQGTPQVFYIWIPFKQEIFCDLPRSRRAPRQDGNRFWFPCLEKKELDRKALREGLVEELMHWIKETIAERSSACLSRVVGLPSPDMDKQRFWDELNKLLDSERPEAIRRLFGLPPEA